MSKKIQVKQKDFLLITHKVFVLFLYVISLVVTYFILNLAVNDENSSLVMIISSGAIIATFGSALSSIAGIWEKDLFAKVIENTDILYTDIIKTEKWRRWGFLPRSKASKQRNGKQLVQELYNPQLPLNVGTDHILVDIPTVVEDFFDLPVIKNTYTLCRYRSAVYTNLSNENSKETASELPPYDNFIAYENLYSSWLAIFKFRLFRYIVHLGTSLIIFSALVTLWFCVKLYT